MSTQQIQPLGNRVLVRRSQVKISKGGIILPDSARGRYPRRSLRSLI
ncbi:MAG: hypothetical protein EB051_02190 [Chlamydiia bacterium]|nr:hypothetical protein [Chlamydiia bacterium]